jgi:hypothetical protein
VVRPPYYVAARLTRLAAQRWAQIDGGAVRQAVDPLRLRWDRFLNYVYSWVMELVEDPKAFDADLNEPPLIEGRRDVSAPATLAAEEDSFMSFMSAYQQG